MKQEKVKKFVIGIDPGITGSVCITSNGKFYSNFDIPNTTTDWYVGKSKVLDTGTFKFLLSSIIPKGVEAIFVIEKQFPHRNQGLISTATLMLNYGRLTSIINSMVLGKGQVMYVAPTTWQPAVGYSGDEIKKKNTINAKEKATALTNEIFQDKNNFTRHDERDAALLSWYGWLKVKDLSNKEYVDLFCPF